MTLDEYLDAQGGKRWRWGDCDCVQFGLGWARERSGRPLKAFFAYRSRKDAEGALRARGGLLAIVRDWMAANGFPRVDDPEDGDIGIAPTPGVGEDAIAGYSIVIRYGPWWIGKTPRGIGSAGATEIPAWRVS